jgi:hypothetical protein
VHQAGKQLVAQWIRSTYPEAYLRVDTERVDTGQLPDVLVVMPDGVRYAIEVQYSSLTVAKWHLRHRGYASHGIHDIWLLGHLPPHLQIGGREDNRGRVQVSPLHQAIHAAGGQLLWINPFAEVVGAGTFGLRDHELLMRSSAELFYGEVALALDPLVSCRLEGGRLRTPGLDAASAQLELERAEERRREQERLEAFRRKDDARRRREQTQEQRQRRSREFSEEERQRWKEDASTRRRMEWERYERNAVLPRFGVVPWFIAEYLDSDPYVWGRIPAHWRARIFLDHIYGRVGKTFTFQSVSREFASSHASAKRIPWEFITDFLFRLQTAGFIEFEVEPDRFICGEIRVLTDDADTGAPHPPGSLSHEHDWDSILQVEALRSPGEPAADCLRPEPAPNSSGPAVPPPVNTDELPTWLRELIGIPGRKLWQELQAIHIRRLRSVPPVLEAPTPHDGAFVVHPALWKHFVVDRLVNDRVGHLAGPASALRCLGFDYRKAPATIRSAIEAFLAHLAAVGYIQGPNGRGRVLKNLTVPTLPSEADTADTPEQPGLFPAACGRPANHSEGRRTLDW